MAVYVRVRDVPLLRYRIAATQTSQAHLARVVNISPSRISQIVSGRHTVIPATLAAALENALGVARGALFELATPSDLVQPYLTAATGAA